MNAGNGFFWLLIAFPVYLLANGKFVNYLKLLGTTGGDVAGSGSQGSSNRGGLNNNQAVV